MDAKRILVIGKPKSGKVTFVKALTGSLPKGLNLASNETSHAGLSHEFTLRNKYFQKEIGLWIDEYTNLQETLEAYASDEAKEIIDAIGAIVYTFRTYEPQEWSHWESFIQNLEKPIPMVGLHMDTASMMSPPDCSYLEYVAFSQTGKNEFGEKLGLERVLELFDCCEWDLDSNENSSEQHTLLGNDAPMSPDEVELDSLIDQAKHIRGSSLDIQERKKQAMSIINSLVNEGFQESDLD